MPKINILPDHVANQIAAGEVVERPVAIVKELLENSIDAGAHNISVTFLNGGKDKIIVEDDGYGMSKKNAELAILRHATSKLNNISDLQTLNTFGFRGEALSSIASVSRFLLHTRTKTSDTGTEILINGGKIIHVTECAMPVGTMVEVSNLFHNVPARRRFLKSNDVEAGHIVKLVKSFMFAEKNLNISLYEGTKKIDSSRNFIDWATQSKEIFNVKENLANIFYEKNCLTVCGAICKQGNGETSQRNIMTFVNRRLVTSNALNMAISDAFTGFLPMNRKPIAFLLLSLDIIAVDVNVHPTKREVRFRNEFFVKEFIKEAILFHMKSLCNETIGCKIIENNPINERKLFIPNFIKINSSFSDSVNGIQQFGDQKHSRVAHINLAQIDKQAQSFDGNSDKISFVSNDTVDIFSQTEARNNWKFIGLARGDCALFESETGLVMFNIKLAVRRITYNNILGNLLFDSQNLLIPIDIPFEKQHCENIESILSVFEKYGFQIYQSGKNTLKLSSVPVWCDVGLAEIAIIDIIDQSHLRDCTDLTKNFAQTISCVADFKQYKTQADIELLIATLSACKNHTVCPKGYQIFFEIPFADFYKRFGC